ncbi:FlgO family outer membrane protein [Celerinatantimonas sp. YJH-8]|uniref:FlgO family outer membrane protein n=1 Tax=Celerinatantimonas sp. YJH-8 TaxID=3228714 RepID=UPI0038C46258
MKSIMLGLVLTSMLSGCSMLGWGDSSSDQSNQQPEQPGYYQPVSTTTAEKKEEPGFWSQLFFGSDKKKEQPKPAPRPVVKTVDDEKVQPLMKHNLADYVAGMAQQMLNSARYVNPSTPIGVASFVALNDLRQTNVFGMQLAESFVYEMQQHGMSVIDYKATGFIRITPSGDFVYSRNVKELAKEQPIQYLLVGTYTRTSYGYMVNARIVGAESKVVVASAQQLIPTQVYNNAMDIDPSRAKPKVKDGVVLIRSN